MIHLKSDHLVTGEELSPSEIENLIYFAIDLKKERSKGVTPPLLSGKNLALLFDKPSLRTRFSFTVAVTELGGSCIESLSNTRKQEDPEDVAKVLNAYCHGVVIRTHDDSIIQRMAKTSKIPLINGLTRLHHPCQILADLMTLKEVYDDLQGLNLTYVGDGNNILNSLLLLAPCLGIHVRYACPDQYHPDANILERAKARALKLNTKISSFSSPKEAVHGSHALYTDVWTSMGFEKETQARESAFADYQVNEALLAHAASGAVVMHCLPMVRGKEISQTLPDSAASVIFHQSENRLHLQKALLIALLAKDRQRTAEQRSAEQRSNR